MNPVTNYTTERKTHTNTHTQTNSRLDDEEAECRHPNKMSRSFAKFPALSQVLYSESITRDRHARHQQGPLITIASAEVLLAFGSHMVIDLGKCTHRREATPTFIRT